MESNPITSKFVPTLFGLEKTVSNYIDIHKQCMKMKITLGKDYKNVNFKLSTAILDYQDSIISTLCKEDNSECTKSNTFDIEVDAIEPLNKTISNHVFIQQKCFDINKIIDNSYFSLIAEYCGDLYHIQNQVHDQLVEMDAKRNPIQKARKVTKKKTNKNSWTNCKVLETKPGIEKKSVIESAIKPKKKKAKKNISQVNNTANSSPQILDPAMESNTKSVTESIEFDNHCIVESIGDPVTEPNVGPVIESFIEPIVEPIVEPKIDPIVEHIVKPIVESIVEPTDKLIDDFIDDFIDKSVDELIDELIDDSVVEPIVEPNVEHIFDPIVEPIVKPIVEPRNVPINNHNSKPQKKKSKAKNINTKIENRNKNIKKPVYGPVIKPSSHIYETQSSTKLSYSQIVSKSNTKIEPVNISPQIPYSENKGILKTKRRRSRNRYRKPIESTKIEPINSSLQIHNTQLSYSQIVEKPFNKSAKPFNKPITKTLPNKHHKKTIVSTNIKQQDLVLNFCENEIIPSILKEASLEETDKFSENKVANLSLENSTNLPEINDTIEPAKLFSQNPSLQELPAPSKVEPAILIPQPPLIVNKLDWKLTTNNNVNIKIIPGQPHTALEQLLLLDSWI